MSKYEHTECDKCGAGLRLEPEIHCPECLIIEQAEEIGHLKGAVADLQFKLDKVGSGRVMTFAQLIMNISHWADARGILSYSTAQAQLLKAFSEMGELADATIKNDHDGAVDAVGDVLVCLINYCEMRGLSIYECLAVAWDAIKDRKGHMVPGGAFVKEESK